MAASVLNRWFARTENENAEERSPKYFLITIHSVVLLETQFIANQSSYWRKGQTIIDIVIKIQSRPNVE